MVCPEAEFLDEIHIKVLRVFLIAIHSHLYSFALRFLVLQTHATSYSFCRVLLYTVKETGEKKPELKTTPPSLWFKKSIQKPQNYAQKTSKKLYAHEFGFCSSSSTQKDMLFLANYGQQMKYILSYIKKSVFQPSA